MAIISHSGRTPCSAQKSSISGFLDPPMSEAGEGLAAGTIGAPLTPSGFDRADQDLNTVPLHSAM